MNSSYGGNTTIGIAQLCLSAVLKIYKSVAQEAVTIPVEEINITRKIPKWVKYISTFRESVYQNKSLDSSELRQHTYMVEGMEKKYNKINIRPRSYYGHRPSLSTA